MVSLDCMPSVTSRRKTISTFLWIDLMFSYDFTGLMLANWSNFLRIGGMIQVGSLRG